MTAAIHRSAFPGTRRRGLAEFLEEVASILARDPEWTLEGLGPVLAGLALTPDLVVETLGTRAASFFADRAWAGASRIGLGEGPGFTLAAQAWPSATECASGRIPSPDPPYGSACDTVEPELVVGYSGPGYTETLFTHAVIDREIAVGDPVALRKLDEFTLSPGTVVRHHPFRDVHLRQAPAALSFSLVLSGIAPQAVMTSRLFFDVEAGVIAGGPTHPVASLQASFLDLASLVLGAEQSDGLARVARAHPLADVRTHAERLLARDKA